MNWTFLGIIIVLLTASAVTISIVYWSWRNGISPMPSSRAAKKAILALLPNDLEGPIYELGSGWGTLAFALADKFPNCAIKAYETSLIPYFVCLLRIKFSPRPLLNFHRQDFFSISLKPATAVVCYLYPKAMQRLKPKLEHELSLSCWIVSNTFALPQWKHLSVVELCDLYNTKIYLYRKLRNEKN